MHGLVVISLFALGFASLWFGLVEDLKFAFALGLIFLAAATFMTFSGKPGKVPPPRPRSSVAAQRSGVDAREMGLPVAVTIGLLLGAACVWLGLIEDIKIAMLAGIVIWAGAVLATFRGKAAPF
jgi:hypothetical protein